MHQLLALLTGSILSIMILINGNLTVYYGVYFAAVIIHVVGSGFAFILRTLQKERKPLFTHGPKWIYLGGAIGVFTTVFNNFAYGHISLTSIVALGLLGQSVTSLIIDTFGLFGMKKQLLDKRSIPGLIISVSGILFMLDRSVSYAFLAVLLSLGSGITVVLSRTANARLAEKTGALQGSLINHLVGLPCTIIIALRAGELTPNLSGVATRPWIYLGGVLGVVIVLLNNLTVPKVTAFRLTLLTFVGQVFTGVFFDLLLGADISSVSFLGGVIIVAGLAVNLVVERRTG